MDTRTRATGQPENILFPNAKRHVAAGFAEVYVPLVGDSNAAPGARELALSLAARFDDYGDFGDTTNPKVGVLWRPLEELSLKANRGSSFRAPALRELYIRATTFSNFSIVDPNAPGGPTTVFVPYITGGNPTSSLRKRTPTRSRPSIGLRSGRARALLSATSTRITKIAFGALPKGRRRSFFCR